jgi:hypothetical protein
MKADGRLEPTPQHSVWQFNLREILLQTAMVAILITAIRASLPTNRGYSVPFTVVSIAIEFGVSLAIAIVMAATLWTVLGQRASWKGFVSLASLVTFIGAAMGLGFTFMRPARGYWLATIPSWWWLAELCWWWLPWLGLTAGFLAATLWFLRENGYRLVKRNCPASIG